MSIENIKFQNNFYSNSNSRAQFGALTGARGQENQGIKKVSTPVENKNSFKELSITDYENAQAIAQALNPQEVEEAGFFESLAKDSKDIWNSLTTMFNEPTQEELAQGFREIDSYSSLKPENYWANVDSNNEVIPQYDDEDLYQLVA